MNSTLKQFIETIGLISIILITVGIYCWAGKPFFKKFIPLTVKTYKDWLGNIGILILIIGIIIGFIQFFRFFIDIIIYF